MNSKKILIPLFLIGLFSLSSCHSNDNGGSANSFTLPDLYGMQVSDAKLEVGANVLFEEVEVKTSELIEGRILGYADDLEAGDSVTKGSRVKIEVAKRQDSAIAIDSELVDYYNVIDYVTGPDSPNADILLNAGAYGTDLGIPFALPDGRTMLLYGDTFSGANMQGFWNSNFMAITSDKVFYDGLQFDSVVTNDIGAIKPFAQGLHQEDTYENIGTEVTKIPTGGISVNGEAYIFYMSIRYWGVAGSWLVSYNQCLKATDDTYSEWVEVPSLRWTEDELYYAGQIYPYQDPNDMEHIYFLSIPGGRNDGAVMFRVTTDNFENRDEYEYLVGDDTWVKGDEGMERLNSKPYYVCDPAVAEPSLMYSEYLDKYLVATLKGSSIVLLASDKITGPYDDIYPVINASDYFGLYGGFITPLISDSEGQRIYIQLSQWNPIYNTSLVEVILK